MGLLFVVVCKLHSFNAKILTSNWEIRIQYLKTWRDSVQTWLLICMNSNNDVKWETSMLRRNYVNTLCLLQSLQKCVLIFLSANTFAGLYWTFKGTKKAWIQPVLNSPLANCFVCYYTIVYFSAHFITYVVFHSCQCSDLNLE